MQQAVDPRAKWTEEVLSKTQLKTTIEDLENKVNQRFESLEQQFNNQVDLNIYHTPQDVVVDKIEKSPLLPLSNLPKKKLIKHLRQSVVNN